MSRKGRKGEREGLLENEGRYVEYVNRVRELRI